MCMYLLADSCSSLKLPCKVTSSAVTTVAADVAFKIHGAIWSHEWPSGWQLQPGCPLHLPMLRAQLQSHHHQLCYRCSNVAERHKVCIHCHMSN